MATCLAASVAPDADILFGVHRGPWHSLAAGAIAAAVVGLVCWVRRQGPRRLTLACLAAWESHVLLDWLGKDTSPPLGVMALWPFSQSYFRSSLGIFPEVSRRYWRPSEFIVGNLESLAWELAILGPPFLLIWLWHRRHGRFAPGSAK
jgi:membrane-bound metal-dependent hydrolase YbcI (DUF457 family)